MRVCLAQRRLYYNSTQTVSGGADGLDACKTSDALGAGPALPSIAGWIPVLEKLPVISSSGDTKLIRGQNNSCRMRRPLVHFYLAYCRLSEPRGNMLYLPGRNHSTVLPLHQ